MPAQAGIQESGAYADTVRWIPACAGMTVETVDVSYLRLDALAASLSFGERRHHSSDLVGKVK
jgi:hypothetical protein